MSNEARAIKGEFNIRNLKPCPFCGGEPKVNSDYQGYGNTVVWCSNCYCTTAPYPNPLDAYTIWDTRKREARLVEALERAKLQLEEMDIAMRVAPHLAKECFDIAMGHIDQALTHKEER